MADDEFGRGRVTTALADGPVPARLAVDVLAAGPQTTVQEWPGRRGYWEVGVPPSGPMDDVAFRVANRLVGNDPGLPALECTMSGPTLRFAHRRGRRARGRGDGRPSSTASPCRGVCRSTWKPARRCGSAR